MLLNRVQTRLYVANGNSDPVAMIDPLPSATSLATLPWQDMICSATCEGIVQRGALDTECPANRRFARASVQGSPDRGEFFITDDLGPSTPFPTAPRGRQARLDAFLRQGAFVLGQSTEHA